MTPPKPTCGIAVDGSARGNPGPVEWRGVDIATAVEVFHSREYADGTNNVSEFLAIVHALAWLKERGRDDAVYSDSKTGRAWVRDRRCKTKFSGISTELVKIVQRAEEWLRANPYANKVVAWDTVNWQEIPADFGRK